MLVAVAAVFDITSHIRYNINWNYGLFPQTWEDPTTANSDVEGAFGDNDPGNDFFLLSLSSMVLY